MQRFPPPELLEPHWFFPAFALLWLGMSALLAVLGGWASLAGQFRSGRASEGERFRFVSGSMGAPLLPVSYGRSLFVTVGDEGIGISVLFLFRFLSPPLFIPWRAVESVEAKRSLFSHYTAIRLRGQWPTISIRGNVGERIRQEYSRIRTTKTP